MHYVEHGVEMVGLLQRCDLMVVLIYPCSFLESLLLKACKNNKSFPIKTVSKFSTVNSYPFGVYFAGISLLCMN